MMNVWPAGFLQSPNRRSWETTPFDTRASFDPEVGPPMFRPRVTAEAWAARATFPMVDETEYAAFMAFWEACGRGAKPFLWRDPDGGGAARKWMFGATDPLRISKVTATRRDIILSLIRLPSTPWWAALSPPDRLVSPLAAYDFRRGLYHNGVAQVGFNAAVSFSRASIGRQLNAAGQDTVQAIGVPRFDYSETGAPRGLLVEPVRVNYRLDSGATPALGLFQAGPPGANAPASVTTLRGLNATLYTRTDSSYAIGRASNAIPVGPGQTLVFSFWAASTNGAKISPAVRNLTNSTWIVGDMVADTTVTLDPAGRRYSLAFTVPAGCTSIDMWFDYGTTGLIGDTIILAAPQLEVGTSVTSWIITAGSAVTRSADVASLLATHGACDVRLTYDDDSAQTLPNQTLAAGWWPVMARHHIASIAMFAPGSLA